MTDVLTVPKAKTTLKSWVEPRKTAKTTQGDSQFYNVVRKPSQSETKKLIGILVSKTTEIVMSNHFFTIGDEVRFQSVGGAIGSDLTGEI